MRAKQRTEREVSRAIRLGRAKRGVEELRRTALAAEQEFSAEFELGPIDIQDSHWESVLIHCGSGQLIRSVVDGQAVRAQ